MVEVLDGVRAPGCWTEIAEGSISPVAVGVNQCGRVWLSAWCRRGLSGCSTCTE